MPDKKTLKRARQDKREGKSPSTQAGEFVHEEIEHIREGKHGARTAKQAIAIGLSKARRAGVKLPPPEKGTASASTRKRARQDLKAGRAAPGKSPAPARSRAGKKALQDEGTKAATHVALSRQARSSARRRSTASRRRAADKAVRTKGTAAIKTAARKAARTRAKANDYNR